MKLSLLLLTLAGLGLAQEPTKMKISGSPSQSVDLTDWTKQTTAHTVIYTTTPVASQPFYVKFDNPDKPEVFTITNRDGKPLVRCITKTQTCEVIK